MSLNLQLLICRWKSSKPIILCCYLIKQFYQHETALRSLLDKYEEDRMKEQPCKRWVMQKSYSLPTKSIFLCACKKKAMMEGPRIVCKEFYTWMKDWFLCLEINGFILKEKYLTHLVSQCVPRIKYLCQ